MARLCKHDSGVGNLVVYRVKTLKSKVLNNAPDRGPISYWVPVLTGEILVTILDLSLLLMSFSHVRKFRIKHVFI